MGTQEKVLQAQIVRFSEQRRYVYEPAQSEFDFCYKLLVTYFIADKFDLVDIIECSQSALVNFFLDTYF